MFFPYLCLVMKFKYTNTFNHIVLNYSLLAILLNGLARKMRGPFGQSNVLAACRVSLAAGACENLVLAGPPERTLPC